MSEQNGRNPKFVFPDTIPDTNWCKQYFLHQCENIEAPYQEYHFAVSLSFVQHWVGRNAYITINGRKHYSNLNQLLLGATTISHKTDAIDPLRYWLQSRCCEKMLPSDFSGAGLLEALEVTPDGYIVLDEAGTLFNRIANNKEAGTIRDILCKVYDNDPSIFKQLSSRGKKDGNGAIRIVNAFPTLIMGTTPQTFSQYAMALDMTSGFLVRFLMYSPDAPKPSIPMVFGYDRETNEKPLIDYLDKLCDKIKKSTFGFSFKPDPSAEKFFDEWKVTNEEKYRDNHLHAAIFNRLMVMSLKMTMLMMLADPETLSIEKNPLIGNGEREPFHILIPLSYLKPVCELVDSYFMPHAISVYETIERDASKNIQDKIISKLLAYGGEVEVWRLSKDLHILSADRDRHLDALFDSREVTMFKRDDTVWCRFWKEGDNEAMAAAHDAEWEEHCKKNEGKLLKARREAEKEARSS